MEAVLDDQQKRHAMQGRMSKDAKGRQEGHVTAGAGGNGRRSPLQPGVWDTAFHAVAPGTPHKGFLGMNGKFF